ncbi:death domain-containing protein [Endozoicomonas sp. ONNA2]|uniref:death domain-containing protein n=1 Tax=Endozoicomonas sp. ONNA2 TaxID=2828741 RepID=UPI0021479EBF|nr:death domain-containing protein [Endozoicomonas sp. ONNA2]
MLGDLDKMGYDPGSVLRRAIQIYNIENPADPIVVVEPDVFTTRFPNLKLWINEEFAFLTSDQVFEFAFATGKLSELSEVEDRHRDPAEVRNQFFQRYFCQEGLQTGFEKLQLLTSTGILTNDIQKSQLDKAISRHQHLERIGVIEKPQNLSNFNFPAVLPVAREFAVNWTRLARSLHKFIDPSDVERISSRYPQNIVKATLTFLHEFACNNGKIQDLIPKLKAPFLGKVALAEKLEEIL